MLSHWCYKGPSRSDVFYLIEVASDHADAKPIVTGAAEKIACELDYDGGAVWRVEVKDSEGNSIEGWSSES